MFAKAAIFSFVLTALTSNVLAKPLPITPPVMPVARGFPPKAPSFNNWPGVSSLHGFDDFYGSDNFDCSSNKQVVVKEKQVVCHTEQIKIIQQRLAVIQEIAKKVVTELVCDVETQTVVFEQFHASLGSFGRDVSHLSGSDRQIGYDSSIISHFPQIIQSDGSCSTNDFGFSGSSVGSSLICPSGSDWSDDKSPNLVGMARYQCGRAVFGSQFYGGSDEFVCDSSETSVVSSSSSSSSHDSGSIIVGDSSSESHDCSDCDVSIETSNHDYNTYGYNYGNNYNTYSTYENNYNTYGNNYNTYSTDENNYNTYSTYENNYNTYGNNYNTYSSVEVCDDCWTSTTSAYENSYTSSVEVCDDCWSSTTSAYESSYTSSCDEDDCDWSSSAGYYGPSSSYALPVPSGSSKIPTTSVVPTKVPTTSAKVPTASGTKVPAASSSAAAAPSASASASA